MELDINVSLFNLLLCPFINIFPSVGSISPLIISIKVVFPDPDFPQIPIILFSFNS